MMYLVGGVPNIYHENVKPLLANELRRSSSHDHFLSRPLKPLIDGTYMVEEHYCNQLINDLIVYFSNNVGCLDKGLAVIMFSCGLNKIQIENRFFPFAFYVEGENVVSNKRSNYQDRKIAKEYSTNIFQYFKKIREPVSALNIEFSDRLQRTPLLLPIRHFASAEHKAMLHALVSKLNGSENPSEIIKSECEGFQRNYPLKNSDSKRGRARDTKSNKYFENDRGVWFTSPGRAFHGRRLEQVEAPHDQRCFLNSRLRLGGVYQDGFHYDCTKAGKPHKGIFYNCHDANEHYTGNPHLNIFPDDYIR
jgi:hypothetical protein